MATVEQKVPSPDTFLFKSWSTYSDVAKLHLCENVDAKETTNGREAMKLNKDDMHVFGQCPAQDSFFLVVCNTCSRVVKPQEFLVHCERRHKHPCHPRVPLDVTVPLRPKDGVVDPFSKTSRPTHARRECRDSLRVSVPVVSLRKMSCVGGAGEAPPTPARPPAHRTRERLVNGFERRTDTTSHLDKPGTPYNRLSGRVFDPNQHCGVVHAQSRRPCTRSLTCKRHSLGDRRAVPGRIRHFDLLLAEHRGQTREKETKRDTLSHQCPGSLDNKSTSPIKPQLTNTHLSRSYVGPSVDPAPLAVGTNQSEKLSSDEGDLDTLKATDRWDCPHASRHPQPMASCPYSGRLLGRGCYVFDRRWDRTRRALLTVFEINSVSHTWRNASLTSQNLRPATPGGLPAQLTLNIARSAGLRQNGTVPASGPPDRVSMATCRAAFPRSNCRNVFGVADPEAPGPQVSPLTPDKKLRPKPNGQSVGGAKKRKSPPTLLRSRLSTCTDSSLLPSAAVSNGDVPKPRPSHTDSTPSSFTHSEARTRRSAHSYEKSGMNNMYRRAGRGFPSAVSDSPHSALAWQPKVHH